MGNSNRVDAVASPPECCPYCKAPRIGIDAGWLGFACYTTIRLNARVREGTLRPVATRTLKCIALARKAAA